jgi:tetratricopeptide (TPR) repeat protein
MIRTIFVVAFAAVSALGAARPIDRVPRTDERISDIERRLKQSPKDPALQNELAGAFLQKMRETADGAYLERTSRIVASILAADPANYDARRRLLEIEMQRHHFQQVVTAANALARERPEDPVVYGLLGDALMELGDYDHAPDAYQKMVDLRPSLASYNRVAFYRFVTGDGEGAIAMMRRAIGIGAAAPENVAWCLTDIGNMLFKTGAVADAEQAYREALTLFPGFHHAQAGLGRVLASRGQFDEAVDAFRKAQAVAPFPEYAEWLAKLYGRLGQNELRARQIQMLDVADKLNNAAGEAANRNLALAFADLDHNLGRSLALARAELDIRRDVYSYDALAWALFKNGQIAEAGAAIQKALVQNTPEPSFHEHAAKIFDAMGRQEEAKKHRERAAALNPKFNIS